jgi:hypothetical protein
MIKKKKTKTKKNWLLKECVHLNKYIYVYTKDTIAESIRQKFVSNARKKKCDRYIK